MKKAVLWLVLGVMAVAAAVGLCAWRVSRTGYTRRRKGTPPIAGRAVQ